MLTDEKNVKGVAWGHTFPATVKCNKCGKTSHVKPVCRSGLPQQPRQPSAGTARQVGGPDTSADATPQLDASQPSKAAQSILFKIGKLKIW